MCGYNEHCKPNAESLQDVSLRFQFRVECVERTMEYSPGKRELGDECDLSGPRQLIWTRWPRCELMNLWTLYMTLSGWKPARTAETNDQEQERIDN